MDDDIDIDALIDEEEEIMAELRQAAQESETLSRKRVMNEDVEVVPRKHRKSVAQRDNRLPEESASQILESDKENEILAMNARSQTALSRPTPLFWEESEDGQLVIDEELDVVPVLESSVVMTQRPDASSDYMTVCAENGSRFYLNVRTEDEIEMEEKALGVRTKLQFRSLTEEAFDDIIEKAKLERKRWEEPSIEEMHSVRPDDSAELWVDKYSPRGYTDLLSEEYVNRALLTWIKAWDSSVFGKAQRRTSRPSVLPTPFGQPVMKPEVDESGRPLQKVALLCGPPGLGKTTLAYIAARHCGYSVIEVNASDDRSPELFRQRLESGANTRYSLDGDQRPLCMVLDEIDGAPQPAIDVLVAACKASPGAKNNTRKRGATSGVHAILRPVICICNELYALALRQLRPLAFIIKFPTPQVSRLASRLLEVMHLEKMKADIGALSALAERSERDIRSCLNILQFIRGRGHTEITTNLLTSLKLGQKDVQKGIFSAWHEVFTLPRASNDHASRAAAFAAGVSHATSILAQRAANVLRACGRSAGGDWQRLVDGLHENFLDMRFKDSRMKKISGAFDWLRFVDSIAKMMGRTQDYSLLRYQSYIAVYFHLNFASSHPERLQWPQAGMACYQASTRSQQILDAVTAGISAGTRFTRRALITEVLPHLVDILQPNLRPVNTQLYSGRERLELAGLVSTMIQFGLELRQERSPDGQYDYVLEPDLVLVARFPSVRLTKSLSYAAKQLVARELTMERLRRTEVGRGRMRAATDATSNPTATSLPPPKSAPSTTASSPSTRRQSAWSIAEQVQQVRSVRTERSRDFFGRPVVTEAPSLSDIKGVDKEIEKSPLNEKIWFRFKEGYSNAIRRPVRIKDLL